MTVLERLKAAGYDPAVSLFPDSIGNAGSMECERVQIRTFFCRPRENEAAIGVTATAMTHFSDDEKPEWTSLEEIERFSKKMLEEEIY